MQHKKTKLSVVFLAGIGLSGLYAQDATTASGGDATGSGGSASYSIGQPVYTSNTSASGSVNQGVQQPYEIITSLNNNPDINLVVSVYPNPSIDYVNLVVGSKDLSNLTFQLFDINGKVLVSQKIDATQTAIKMADYAVGNYFLRVIDNNKTEVKSFKIIKN